MNILYTALFRLPNKTSLYVCIHTYTGCNKKIEPAKYLEKYTLDGKVKENAYLMFLKSYLFMGKLTMYLPP